MASLKVAVRVRPLNKRERDMGANFIISMEAAKTFITNVKLPQTTMVDTLGRERVKQFTYDYSYASVDRTDTKYASQLKVYEDLGHDVVRAAYEGYNACVFAYGQTGSGKTYTMMGNPDDQGLIPRICHSLFGQMEDGETTYRCEVSYLEIYNERVRDLLREAKGEPPNLRVREHPKDGPYVQDLSKHLVMDYEDIEKLINRGNENRTTAATNMNDVSSRSHAIFTITFVQARFIDEIPSEIHSKIHLVDLAGSERVDASGVTGMRLKEGGSINKSLVTLGKIISTLADLSDKIPGQRNKVFIPYRDSVLTYLLQDSLGGNAKTIMIATISPADCNYAETLSTLRYASRAKRIINEPKVNEDPNVKLIRELREENAKLKALLGQNVDFMENAEKLCANEEKVKRLTQKWTGKWQEAASILEEHKALALRKEGIGVVLDSELPYLLALHDDVLSTGMRLYHLQEGETRVGREDATVKQHIVLEGQFIEPEHALIRHFNAEVTLVPLDGAMCSVNNSRVHEATMLSQGAILRLGRGHVFRFNYPKEAARLREELKLSGNNHLIKVKQDFQWTWSSLSVNDSAFGSDWDIPTEDTLVVSGSRSSEQERLEQKRNVPSTSASTTTGYLAEDKISELDSVRKQIEQLEEEHCLAEAQRLSQLAEQEGTRVELEERELELNQLKSDAERKRLEAEAAQKEIKRLSANFEQQFEEALKEQERIVHEQSRIHEEKERLEGERRKAKAERQRLRQEREKEKVKLQLEKERQLEEWAELNNQRRQAAIALQKEKEELQVKQKQKEALLKVEKEVEKEVFTAAVSEMRSLIEAEVKEIRRISGLPVQSPVNDSSPHSLTMTSLSSQEDRLDDSLEEDEFTHPQRDAPLSNRRDPSPSLSNQREALPSISNHRDFTSLSNHRDSSPSLSSHRVQSVSPSPGPLRCSSPRPILREVAESSVSSGSPKSFRTCTSFEIEPFSPPPLAAPTTQEPGPVLPAKYLQGSPITELPRSLPPGLGMEDSFASITDHLAEMVAAEVNMMSSMTDSVASSQPGSSLQGSSIQGSSMADSMTEKMSESSTGSMSNEDILNMLRQLSSKVNDIHQKVCQSLRRKYTSILSSDDTTAGLGSEVISQFSHIRPLFDELERMAAQTRGAEQTEIPERLENYDRMLTVVDQFLRIHEAIQAIVAGIKRRRFLEVIENLDIVNSLLQAVDIETDLDSTVHKVLQTEICIQREQLYFQLGESWSSLVNWRLPGDAKRTNVNQPRTASLEISEQGDLKAIMTQTVQGMQMVNMLGARVKLLCDRIMLHFVEAIVKDRNSLIQVVADEDKSVLCVVQYSQGGDGAGSSRRGSTASTSSTHSGAVVPPGEVFPKLEQIFIFLHRPLSGVTVEERMDSEDGRLKQLTPFVQKIGNEICPRLFDYIFNECLSHSMPRGNRNMDKFNEAVQLTEKFQDLLMSLNFMPTDHTSLMDYFNNVNSLFANMKSQDILRRAHELMTQDLQSSLQVSTDHPLGTLKDTRQLPVGIKVNDTLIEFVKSCRDDAAAGGQKIPTCQISLPVRSLLVLAYDMLRDAISGSPDTAMHLSYSLHNIFELFADIIPSYHREKLTNMPLLAALHHNNCMFVAHHIQTMDRHFRKKMALSANPSRHANLGELVPRTRKLGNDNFTQHILLKKEQLCDHLIGAEGFECVADDDGESARDAIIQMLHHLRHISATWSDVLPNKVYCKAMGTLLNATVVDIIDNVLAIGEFSADDCEVLQAVLVLVLEAAPRLFTLPGSGENPEVTLHEFVSNWMKFRELHLALGSNLRQVADRWADGKGPLALYFTADEMRRLVVAMFENTSKRDAVLAQLR